MNFSWLFWIVPVFAYIMLVFIIKETLFQSSILVALKRDYPITKNEKLLIRLIAIFWPIGVPFGLLCWGINKFFED